MDLGVNWIDTAPMYGHGFSEEVIGRALKKTSLKPVIATKCGIRWDQTHSRILIQKKESIVEECENSLKRLRVEVIDLYQMHVNQPNDDLEEGYEAMARCLKDGKVRYIGVSNYSVADLERIKDIHPIASLQPDYSMIHREFENELLEYCGQENIGVVAYSPMARGLLTGAFSKNRVERLPDTDNRKKNKDFYEPHISATLTLVEGLRPIAADKGITLAQLTIAWALRHTEVTAAIVGARREGQMVETSKAVDVEFSRGELKNIELLLERREKSLPQDI
jgi:aryl-alcohol dehydrogenase-like predicted oxidoreductase